MAGGVGERIEETLRGMIARGELKRGDKLPSERQMAEQYEASRTTVRLVLTKLAAQGVVEPQHGRGYFVRSVPRSIRAAKATGQ